MIPLTEHLYTDDRLGVPRDLSIFFKRLAKESMKGPILVRRNQWAVKLSTVVEARVTNLIISYIFRQLFLNLEGWKKR